MLTWGALLLVSFVFLVSEPVTDTWYDTIVGFTLVKAVSVVVFGLSLYQLGYIEERDTDEETEETENTNN